MSKRTVRKAQGRSNMPLLLGGLVILAVAVWFVLQPGAGSGAEPRSISPAAYQTEYLVAGTAHVLLDVRTPAEFASGHISGAINIAVEELPQRLAEVPQGQPVIVYCRSGNRSASAVRILAGAGYTPVYDLGGIIDWQAAGYPIQ
jgi:rhodanese-related sulfurtransferase